MANKANVLGFVGSPKAPLQNLKRSYRSRMIDLSVGLQIPNNLEGIRSWDVSRRLSAFLEGIWSPRVSKLPV